MGTTVYASDVALRLGGVSRRSPNAQSLRLGRDCLAALSHVVDLSKCVPVDSIFDGRPGGYRRLSDRLAVAHYRASRTYRRRHGLGPRTDGGYLRDDVDGYPDWLARFVLCDGGIPGRDGCDARPGAVGGGASLYGFGPVLHRPGCRGVAGLEAS